MHEFKKKKSLCISKMVSKTGLLGPVSLRLPSLKAHFDLIGQFPESCRGHPLLISCVLLMLSGCALHVTERAQSFASPVRLTDFPSSRLLGCSCF